MIYGSKIKFCYCSFPPKKPKSASLKKLINMTQEPIQQLEDKHNESEEIRTTRLKGQNKFNRPGKKQ